MKIRRIISLIIATVLLLSAAAALAGCGGGKAGRSTEEAFLASTGGKISLYGYNEDKKFVQIDELVRGTRVTMFTDGKATEAEEGYTEILYNDENCYVSTNSLVDEYSKCVQEKVKYVRTSVTVYQNNTDWRIESWIKKGNELQVLGFDFLDKDGQVEMYKISSGSTTGWVYGKYLVDTQAAADAVYNENGTFDIHNGRDYYFPLWGGYPEDLDYYPYERVELNHPLLREAKTMYLNAEAAINNEAYIECALENGVNAMVMDIKDGQLTYASEVAKELSPTSYNTYCCEIDTFKESVQRVKDNGLYTIGRIVVFNDYLYAQDHPETCIDSVYSSGEWPSGFNREAWYYNVSLAIEAVQLFGFDEIQFDYIRFPESTWMMSEYDETVDFKNEYGESKGEAIQNFLFYAADEIHKAGAYFSIDVFGECVGTYVTAYGQYWPAMSNIVDVISAMPYTDHYGFDEDTWSEPFYIMDSFASQAEDRQKEIPTPAVARTWVTGYNTPHWDPVVDYDTSKMIEQVSPLYEHGLDGGFIPWNAGSDLGKYWEYGAAWAHDYHQD